MHLVEQFKKAIRNAINTFYQGKKISIERQRNIDDIKAILKCNNPLKLRLRLDQYITQLSTGFEAYIPFLEINRFKNELKKVLALDMYQENAILKSMMLDMGVSLTQDNISLDGQENQSVLDRIEKLEQQHHIQSLKILDMDQEIKRLYSENQFLSKAISLLAEKNKELLEENQKLIKAATDQQQAYQALNKNYQQLLKENTELKSKLRQMTGQNVSPATQEKSEPKKEDLKVKEEKSAEEKNKNNEKIGLPTDKSTKQGETECVYVFPKCQPGSQARSKEKEKRLSLSI